jgi:hypothetical protein
VQRSSSCQRTRSVNRIVNSHPLCGNFKQLDNSPAIEAGRHRAVNRDAQRVECARRLHFRCSKHIKFLRGCGLFEVVTARQRGCNFVAFTIPRTMPRSDLAGIKRARRKRSKAKDSQRARTFRDRDRRDRACGGGDDRNVSDSVRSTRMNFVSIRLMLGVKRGSSQSSPEMTQMTRHRAALQRSFAANVVKPPAFVAIIYSLSRRADLGSTGNVPPWAARRCV